MPRTKDIDRIAALPRRLESQDLSDAVTRYCAKDPAQPQWPLHREQAQALVEADQNKGLVFSAQVGSGKTLTSLLIPHVCDHSAPLLMMPADLINKCETEDLPNHRPYWHIVPPILKSYTALSRDKDLTGRSTLLGSLNPDCIILDEAHYVQNLDAGVTRKLLRYLDDHPQIRLYVMTGTLFKTGLMDAWHLCRYALRDASPLPLAKATCRHWADITDGAKPTPNRIADAAKAGLDRLGPGDPRDTVREWVRASPGYVTAGSKYNGPLSIAHLELPPSDLVKEYLELAERGLRPDGQPIDAFDRIGASYPGEAEADQRTQMPKWQLQQSLYLGYWDKPIIDPPVEWLEARTRWVMRREDIRRVSTTLDTPEAVEYAVQRGRIDTDHDLRDTQRLLREWRAVRDSHRVVTEPQWIDRGAPALRHAAEWVRQSPHRLVWTPGPTAGQAVAELAGAPVKFFGADQRGAWVKPGVVDHSKNQSLLLHIAAAVVSLDANKTGKNLQAPVATRPHFWYENLFLTVPSLAGVWEQAIGRTHRLGQTQHVKVFVVQGIESHRKAWQGAIENAENLQRLTGESQKIIGSTR